MTIAPRPLRLSDSQLALVRRAAASLAPNLRGKFLQSIAHELTDVDPVDDETVQRAVDAIMDARCTAMMAMPARRQSKGGLRSL